MDHTFIILKEIYEILQKNDISKEIINHSDLCNNLIKDFKEPKKNNKKIIETINELGQKTLLRNNVQIK